MHEVPSRPWGVRPHPTLHPRRVSWGHCPHFQMRIQRLAQPDDPARGSRTSFPLTAQPQLLQSLRNTLSVRDAVSSFAEVTSTPSFSSSNPQQNNRLPGYLPCFRGLPAQLACAGPSPRRIHGGAFIHLRATVSSRGLDASRGRWRT